MDAMDAKEAKDMGGSGKCKDLYAHIAEIVDGQCSSSRKEELRALVAQCPSCFEKLGIEEEVRRLLKSSCCEKAPEGLKSSIMRKLSLSITELSITEVSGTDTFTRVEQISVQETVSFEGSNTPANPQDTDN